MSERDPYSAVVSAIGFVRSPYTRRFGTPQQATAHGADAEATVELDAARISPDALTDLSGFERIWLVSWLDRSSSTWSPTVTPPRGEPVRRGVFATRSPDRPNPIGLSAVRLLRIDGLCIVVSGIDLLDGTPILDIKPYVPYADAFPEARAGWLEGIAWDEPQRRKR